MAVVTFLPSIMILSLIKKNNPVFPNKFIYSFPQIWRENHLDLSFLLFIYTPRAIWIKKHVLKLTKLKVDFKRFLFLELTLNNWNSTDECKILCLHGGGSSASGLRQQTGMQDLVNEIDECKFIFGQTPENGGVWV